MKLISFSTPDRASYGALIDSGILDLGARFGARFPDLRSFLAGGLEEAAALMRNVTAPDLPVAAVRFLPVIPNPDKIFCVGHNYEDHRLETRREKTQHPSIFMRYAESQVGHGQPMMRPRESAMFDFEGEIAVVIGKPGRRISEADAWPHIAGYSGYNDGSVRDWQWHTPQFGPGKNFFRTGAFGPYLVTADEIEPGEQLALVTRLNGETMQQADTSQLIFPIPRLIAYCSTFLPLTTGDVIVTGTPGGVGAKRNPPLFLKEGDVVEVEVDKIGTLRNTVIVD
jgi:2-keto-4-pentenoate hydratase/2-oxohepta-3-ene-1,7-dioic acid hydratase in catechol pathway